MAIFGWNGIKFLGLDLAVLFALYGMKKATLSKDDVKSVQSFIFRKSLSGKSKAEKKQMTASFRQGRMKQLLQIERYKDTDAEFQKAYGKKEWLR